VATPATDMGSETPPPEPIKPPNGNKDNTPITAFQCQILNETLLAQAQSFAGLKESIDKMTSETRAQSHEFTALHEAIEGLTHELKLFRESLTSILSRWADMVLAEHQKQRT
jgi:hypothetical protein